MTRPLFIDGDRVTLRVAKEEEPNLRRGENHPDVRRYISAFRTPSRGNDGSDGGGERETPWAVIVPKADSWDEPVGSVSLEAIQRIDGYGNLGVWLLPEAWGEGFAIDACAHVIDYGFRELALNRISANAMAPNERSRRLLTRLGFVHEGTSREAQFADGEYVDTERYGLLEREWEGPANVLEPDSASD